MAPRRVPHPSIRRFVTLNLWGARGPWERRLPLVLNTLRLVDADWVALQEVWDGVAGAENQAQQIASALGYQFIYAPAGPREDGSEGLAILSRSPIQEQRVLQLPHATDRERRVLLSARVRSPHAGAQSLWVHSTHLNYRPWHGRERLDQVLAVEQGLSAADPSGAHVLMGDFNATPDTDEIRWLCGYTEREGRRAFFQDAWAVLHPGDPGYTWSEGNPFLVDSWLPLNRRLDYIFVRPQERSGVGAIHHCQRLFDIPDAQGVFASDHFGLLADVQLAPTEGEQGS